MEIIVRKAIKNDLPAMQELWKEMMDFQKVRDPFFTRPNDGHEDFKKLIIDKIGNDDWLILVVTQKDQPIGFCLGTIGEYPPLFINPRYGHIQNFAITEKFRQKGIGAQLFKEAVSWFKKKGITRIELQIAVANEVAQTFYKKMGFRDLMKTLTMDIQNI